MRRLVVPLAMSVPEWHRGGVSARTLLLSHWRRHFGDAPLVVLL